jgi:prefoldin subunit 5
MAEDTWNAHIRYLEDEVKKIDERADKLEEMAEHLESETKKRLLQELVNHLRDEESYYRKYLALVKTVTSGAPTEQPSR